MGEPTKVDFFSGDYRRQAADGGPIILKNRYFELNPLLATDGNSLLPRPGMKYLTSVGAGPIRGLHAEEGAFDGNLFVASYDTLFRLDKTLAQTTIYTGLFNPERGVVNMTTTAPIGDVPEFLFFADGRNLFIYITSGYATGRIGGVPANNDVVRINDMYYKFTNASVDAGTPDGTVANPWLVALGVSADQAWANFAAAVGANGNPGIQYSTDTDKNPAVTVVLTEGTGVTVQATVVGTPGNGIPTTETGAGIAWDQGATLTNGGSPQVRQVEMPEGLGAFDVATINSFVIVLPTQIDEFKGRFYWIEPGETTVNPLNFATAERSPDEVLGVEVLGDTFVLPGPGSTEMWYVSQDPTNRMQRLQGVVFDRGTWEGTAVAVHEALMVCGSDGSVFKIMGGAPQRVSTPGIEETIRKAIQYQRFLTP